MRDEERERHYIEIVGREPRNLPADHPDRWQWEYAGGKAEREGLLERLADLEQACELLVPVDQPALF